MYEKMEIVPAIVCTFNFNGYEFKVSPSTDTIVRFKDSRYDYLRYADEDRNCLAFVFMGRVALDKLMSLGIPPTEIRETIAEDEYDAWLQYETYADMQQFEEEVSDIDLD